MAARVSEPPKAAAVQQELEGAQHQHATSSWCLCLLRRHLRKVFSQKNRASQGVQEGLSPRQLSAKQMSNKPPKSEFFSSRVVEEGETGTAQLSVDISV